jgi:hypothetical protein
MHAFTPLSPSAAAARRHPPPQIHTKPLLPAATATALSTPAHGFCAAPSPPYEQRQDSATPTDAMGGGGAGARGKIGSRGPAAPAWPPPYACRRAVRDEPLPSAVIRVVLRAASLRLPATKAG